MPFIIVFNIIVCVIVAGVIFTILGCSVASKDNAKKKGEKAEKLNAVIDKVRAIAYLVFFATLVLMIIINLIF